MPTYNVCNASLESDLAFPELDEVEPRGPEFRFTLSQDSVADDGGCEWRHTWRLPDDTPWLLLGLRTSGYLLRFPEMADFAVSQDAREIRCYARPTPRPLPSDTCFSIRKGFGREWECDLAFRSLSRLSMNDIIFRTFVSFESPFAISSALTALTSSILIDGGS